MFLNKTRAMCVILNYITLCYSLTRTVLAEKKKNLAVQVQCSRVQQLFSIWDSSIWLHILITISVLTV